MFPKSPRARRLLQGLAIVGAAWLAGCAVEDTTPRRKVEIPVFPPPPADPRYIWERTLHNSADVVPDDSDGALRRMVTGEVRTGEGMAKPYGVAVRNGRVYVGDTVGRMVLMFDLAQGRFQRIGVSEPGALRMPFGMEVDAQGTLYVVDGTARKVNLYDANGRFVRSLGAELNWKRPAGLGLDEQRQRLYVVDAGGVDSDEHRVHAIDIKSGDLQFSIGRRGTGPGEFNLPRDAAVGSDGRVYVVDGGNFRIQVFSPEGKYLQTFGAIGRRSGQFSRPKEAAIDALGNLYVVDTAFGNFQMFDPQGQLLINVGLRGNRDEPGRFMLPSGIAVDRDGRVYMVDQFFRKVEVFRPAAVPATTAFGAAVNLRQVLAPPPSVVTPGAAEAAAAAASGPANAGAVR
jgi:DNA-binding beta-propeller fold protein YncE